MNKAILIGRLTKEPELRKTKDGTPVVQFTLAVPRIGKREKDYIVVVTWGRLAENCAQYLQKGRLAAVEGRIQTRNYENTEGRKVYVTEVVADNVRFLEFAKDDDANEKRHQTLQDDVEDDFEPF